MSRKIFIEPLKSLDDFVEQNRADAEAKAIEEGKAILRISGDSIHIRAKDGYGVITHDFLCGGIIFNTQGYYPLDIEFNVSLFITKIYIIESSIKLSVIMAFEIDIISDLWRCNE